MKNIHILRAYKEQHSIVRKHTGLLLIQTPRKEYSGTKLNIYITTGEEIKEGDWIIRDNEQPTLVTPNFFWDFGVRYYKIILTTDQDLIEDGVQAIDDEFLEWFVKNPSCERVEVMTDAFTVKEMSMLPIGTGNFKYKIIIPKEELKQETLEEAIKREYEVRKFNGDFPFDPQSFKLGAKWVEKQMEKLKDFETWKEWKNG